MRGAGTEIIIIIIGRRTVRREGVGDIVATAYHRAIGGELKPSRAAVEEDRVRQIRTTQLGDGRVTVSVAVYLHKRVTAIAVLSGRTESKLYVHLYSPLTLTLVGDCALQVRQHLWVRVLCVLPSATVPSRQLLHLFGTVCRSPFGLHHCQFFVVD